MSRTPLLLCLLVLMPARVSARCGRHSDSYSPIRRDNLAEADVLPDEVVLRLLALDGLIQHGACQTENVLRPWDGFHLNDFRSV